MHARGQAQAAEWSERAARMRRAFNERFWHEAGGYLFDVIDGEGGQDPACRPNQVLAIALTHAVLERERWSAVLDVVRERLLTPLGLRTLAAEHADFRGSYDGDLRSRDAAYHQGTVWPWLIGPFVDAWLKAFPADLARPRAWLAEFERHLGDAGIGSISEICDAEPPYAPRGCIAQAWSVAEVLRARLAVGMDAPGG
jgi:glycogen debranching enzyme